MPNNPTVDPKELWEQAQDLAIPRRHKCNCRKAGAIKAEPFECVTACGQVLNWETALKPRETLCLVCFPRPGSQ